MIETSDVHSTKIALIGILGVILTTAATLLAIVLYYAVHERVERARIVEAAQRIDRQVEKIKSGQPVPQPWLDPDIQYATQKAALDNYQVRTIEEENGNQKRSYSIPIEQAMETVLEEASASGQGGQPNDPSARSQEGGTAP